MTTKQATNTQRAEILCVWPGIWLWEDGKEVTNAQFAKDMTELFPGMTFRLVGAVKTLPTTSSGLAVPNTGGRSDVFFYASPNTPDAVVPFCHERLKYKIRWWGDVVQNGDKLIYPPDFLQEHKIE